MRQSETLPKTLISPETGGVLRRDIRPFTVNYAGESVVVDLPGYNPSDEGDWIHIGDDMQAVDAALRGLKEKSRACRRQRPFAPFAPS